MNVIKSHIVSLLTFLGVCSIVHTTLSKKGGKLMQAYCFKCRANKEIKDAKSITIKNGKPATQGVCPSCGTKMFRIGKA